MGSKNIEQNQHKEIINLNTNIHIKSQIKVDLIASWGIISILENAFRNSNLLSVDLPHIIKHVGHKAFSDNHPLEFLKIPINLKCYFQKFYGLINTRKHYLKDNIGSLSSLT